MRDICRCKPVQVLRVGWKSVMVVGVGQVSRGAECSLDH